MTTKEYVIREGDAIIERTVTEREVGISAQFKADLTAGMIVKAKAVHRHPIHGPINLAIASANYFWTVPIKQLTLKAPFKDVDGILVPVFNSQDDPVLSPVWTAPKESLWLVINLVAYQAHDSYLGTLQCNFVWLFAYHGTQLYRLPLANLHDDCRVCTGAKGEWVSNKTHFELIDAELDRLSASRWNNDLWKSAAKTQELFRFKATKDGFETLAPAKDWWTYCETAANTATQYLVL